MIQDNDRSTHENPNFMSATTLWPAKVSSGQGFQLRQPGLAIAEDAALRVVCASLHKGHQERRTMFGTR